MHKKGTTVTHLHVRRICANSDLCAPPKTSVTEITLTLQFLRRKEHNLWFSHLRRDLLLYRKQEEGYTSIIPHNSCLLGKSSREKKGLVFLTEAKGTPAMSDPHTDQSGRSVPWILQLILGELKTSQLGIFCFNHSMFVLLRFKPFYTRSLLKLKAL